MVQLELYSPIPLALASLSVINPWEVDNTTIPKPFNTLGISLTFAYWRNPGLESFRELAYKGEIPGVKKASW